MMTGEETCAVTSPAPHEAPPTPGEIPITPEWEASRLADWQWRDVAPAISQFAPLAARAWAGTLPDAPPGGLPLSPGVRTHSLNGVVHHTWEHMKGVWCHWDGGQGPPDPHRGPSRSRFSDASRFGDILACLRILDTVRAYVRASGSDAPPRDIAGGDAPHRDIAGSDAPPRDIAGGDA